MPPATDSGAQQQQKQQRQQQTDLNTELLVARHAGHSEPVSIAKASPTHALVLTGEMEAQAARLPVISLDLQLSIYCIR